jgi:hypothetical protein
VIRVSVTPFDDSNGISGKVVRIDSNDGEYYEVTEVIGDVEKLAKRWVDDAARALSKIESSALLQCARDLRRAFGLPL